MDRKVKAIKRDRDGNIVALVNSGESWSPRKKADVIKDINENKISYYVEQAARRKYVRVLAEGRLETTSDASSGNNLELLPIG